jgi:hypothetical protein
MLRWLDDLGLIRAFSKTELDRALTFWRPKLGANALDRGALRKILLSLPSRQHGRVTNKIRSETCTEMPAADGLVGQNSPSATLTIYRIAESLGLRLGGDAGSDRRLAETTPHSSSIMNNPSSSDRAPMSGDPHGEAHRLLRILFDLARSGQLRLPQEAEPSVDDNVIRQSIPAHVDASTMRHGLRALIEELSCRSFATITTTPLPPESGDQQSELPTDHLRDDRDDPSQTARSGLGCEDRLDADHPEPASDAVALTEIAEALIASLCGVDLSVDRRHPSPTALALLLHRALATKAPSLVANDTCRMLISDIVKATAFKAGEPASTPCRNVAPADVPHRVAPAPLTLLGKVGGDLLQEIERCLNRRRSSGQTAWLDSRSAGIFRLIRVLLDLSFLPATRRLGILSKSAPSAAAFTPLLSKLAGIDPRVSIDLDPTIAHASGFEAEMSEADLITDWRSLPSAKSKELQHAIFTRLAGQRVLPGNGLAIWRSSDIAGRDVLIATLSEPIVWPIGVSATDDAETFIEGWLGVWTKTFGAPPASLHLVPELASEWSPGDGMELIRQPIAERDGAELRKAFDILGTDQRLSSDVDLTISLIAINLLRAWAHWLKGFETASISFLLENFIRIDGGLAMPDEATLAIDIPPGPLDVVLQLSGYDDPIEDVPWLNGRRIIFNKLGGKF